MKILGSDFMNPIILILLIIISLSLKASKAKEVKKINNLKSQNSNYKLDALKKEGKSDNNLINKGLKDLSSIYKEVSNSKDYKKIKEALTLNSSNNSLDGNEALNRKLKRVNGPRKKLTNENNGWHNLDEESWNTSASVNDVKEIVRLERERMRKINEMFNKDILDQHINNRKLIEEAKNTNR